MFSFNDFSKNTASKLAVIAPNIYLQRIFLIVFLVIIGAAVWWQNSGGSVNYSVQKFSKTYVPDVAAELDFTTAEVAWSGLQFDPQGNLKIGALTETALIDAIALMNEQTSELLMTRMALLLEKQFGDIESQQIIELLPVLKNYKEIEQRWWEESGSNNLSVDKPPAYTELFQIQDELLGERRAKLMFSEQRRLIKIMLASYQIQNDTNLTQAEKDKALMELQTNSQNGFLDDSLGGATESTLNE